MADEPKSKTDETLEEDKQDSESKEPTLEELKTQLAETAAALKKANKEAADRRKKLEAIEQAEADKKAAELSEAEKIKAELERIKAERATLQAQNKTLSLQAAFDKTAQTLKLSFAGEKAREDAYKALDMELVGDDGAGMEQALNALKKDRPYLFGKVEIPESDATAKGKTTGEILTRDLLERKKKEYGAPI